MSLEPRQLNDTDGRLLEYLAAGRSTPKLLRSRMESDPSVDSDEVPSSAYINQRLRRLEEHGHLKNLESVGVYELVDDPREDGTSVYQPGDEEPVDTLGGNVDVEEIKDERDRLEDELQDCQEQLQQARADDGQALDDHLVADLKDAHERAVSAQEGRQIDPSALEDIEMYLERVLEGVDG